MKTPNVNREPQWELTVNRPSFAKVLITIHPVSDSVTGTSADGECWLFCVSVEWGILGQSNFLCLLERQP